MMGYDGGSAVRDSNAPPRWGSTRIGVLYGQRVDGDGDVGKSTRRGALYGQTQVQYPQPKQISGSWITAPYSGCLV